MSANFQPEEDILRQKLIIMENAVSQLSFVKTQLRSNAEHARKEISRAVGHQLDLLRAREQTLLNLLETDVESKERVLCDQMENINQAIGACQQALELAVVGNNSAMQNSIFRMNAMELRPRTNSHLIFKCDPSDMRRAVCNFGEVLSDSSIQEGSDCLVFDNEHNENGPQLIHKSVTSTMRPKYQPMEYNGFEFIRNRLDSTASSVEIIPDNNSPSEGNQGGSPTSEGLNSKMSQTVPLLPGLKRGSKIQFPILSKAFPKVSEEEPEHADDLPETKRTKFEFESVIEDIVKASVEDWLHKPTNVQTTSPCTSEPGSSTEAPSTTSTPSTDSNSNVKRVLNSLFSDMSLHDQAYMNKWLAKEVYAAASAPYESANDARIDWDMIVNRKTFPQSYWIHPSSNPSSNTPTQKNAEPVVGLTH
uniref:BLOC-1-related complex subunit 5 n=1 Tax=Panagrellus redivivus TaxID=6233 RepID=A0A7E4UZN7_PANRE